MRQLTTLLLASLIYLATSLPLLAQSSQWDRLNSELNSLYKQGHYDQALVAAQKALQVAEQTWGPDSLNASVSLNNVATMYQSTGQYAQAEPLYRRALAIREKTLGPDHREVAPILSNLAELYLAQRQFLEAEPLLQRELAIQEKALGPDHPAVAQILDKLARLYATQGQYPRAEPLFKRAVAIQEKTFGPDHSAVARSLVDLADLYEAQGLYPEAEPLYTRAVAMQEKAFGLDNPEVAASMNSFGVFYLDQGRYAQAEPLFKGALAIREKVFGPNHPNVAESLNSLAGMYKGRGQYAQAEPLYKRALAIAENALGPDHPNLAASVNNLAVLYEAQGQYVQAEPLFKRALAIMEKSLGPEHPKVAQGVNNLAELYQTEGQYAQAEPLYQRALAIWEKALGPDHPTLATGLNNLGSLYHDTRQYARAELFYKRALAIWVKGLGPDSIQVALSLGNIALLYYDQGQYRQADPLFKRALAIREKALGPEHPLTIMSYEGLGRNYQSQSKFEQATANFRVACSTRSAMRSARDLSGDRAQALQWDSQSCSTRLSLALWGWFAQGGGAGSSDRPEALKLEAFAASQRAVQSVAGEAMARSAALAAAKTSSVGPQAEAYEAALLERDSLDRQFANAIGVAGQSGIEKRAALSKARDDVAARILRLATELETRAPLYWNYRAPEPVSVASLQAKTGADARLLREDEALIMVLIPRGKDRGLVFALSKEQVAWAQLPLTGDEFKMRIIKLRAQIDPEGYGLQGAAVAQSVGSNTGARAGAFDRQAAYQLYQALLGDASIQAVLKNKPVLLFVPSGPLTSLPPALLVTAPPPDGAERDADPFSLRATAWLLRSKSVALLPAVSSLKTLRQILPADVNASDPLLAFADPDFTRPVTPPKTVLASVPVRGFSTYFRDGLPLAEALDDVPPLPGTRIEGEALVRALQGRPGSLLTGRAASKAELMARNADGRLVKVRVLEFATHGLVAGDASDLAEPALVLAAGVKPEDELLLASEAATLKLNADWVLLSACNTASPDAPEAQGLSGLSRAFFYAGARSLLVSHWRVRDDVAPQLIPAMLLAERKNPAMSRAEALRQASLAVLDDQYLNAANPSAWAPFTLVGEAAR